ncbi:hypothetical protein [uncultured Microbacterium sp.]|uniref:hypothetical protein n=1 Tax=uncultured Microbacterium sp. TaxID=191216 RepID=UPI0028D31E11|nr:hypothetical protein [uncultured Microbacterium sp.]
MTARNTLVRSLHDLSLATWFGGNLMGAVGLNGASAEAKDPTERLRISSIGWGRWAPVQLAALAAHAVGGVGLIVGNKERLATQPESRVNTTVKLALTILAAGTTLWSAVAGMQMAKHSDEPTEGVTEPGAGSSPQLSAAQKQQRVLQWVTPVLTGVLIVLGAQQGEQQRPVAGRLASMFRR